MAKTILAGKQIKKLALQHCFTELGLFDTKLSGFPENFLSCNSPSDAGNWNCQNEQMNYLL